MRMRATVPSSAKAETRYTLYKLLSARSRASRHIVWVINTTSALNEAETSNPCITAAIAGDTAPETLSLDDKGFSTGWGARPRKNSRRPTEDANPISRTTRMPKVLLEWLPNVAARAVDDPMNADIADASAYMHDLQTISVNKQTDLGPSLTIHSLVDASQSEKKYEDRHRDKPNAEERNIGYDIIDLVFFGQLKVGRRYDSAGSPVGVD